jgi:hypothetical protein
MLFLRMHSYIGQEERIFNYFRVVVPIFIEIAQDLAHLAHSKNILD